MQSDTERDQKIIDQAFAKFTADFPEVAQSIEAMRISYADYLSMLSNLSGEIPTTVGNAFTPL
ncbi:MAG TPA: hypothetical protein VHX86_16855 [Tepidisphaeraceae bacterium]|jgi:hypothetical protein|nr:hypothetical protein [Tepidisphaeraceae bacterium]